MDKIIELEQAIKSFLNKYDELEPMLADVFAFKHIHGHPYQGPNWSVELDELRRVVKR